MVFPTRLFLLRHGEVEERYHRVFGGRIDMDLSPRGHEQARALAGFLRRRPIDAIYASPMRRAQQTLAPLASHCPKLAVARPEFREVDFGDWTGLTWEQVHSRYQVSAFDWLEQIERGAIANENAAEVVRIDLRRRELPVAIESLTMTLIPSNAPGAPKGELRIMWGTTELSTDWVVR